MKRIVVTLFSLTLALALSASSVLAQAAPAAAPAAPALSGREEAVRGIGSVGAKSPGGAVAEHRKDPVLLRGFDPERHHSMLREQQDARDARAWRVIIGPQDGSANDRRHVFAEDVERFPMVGFCLDVGAEHRLARQTYLDVDVGGRAGGRLDTPYPPSP